MRNSILFFLLFLFVTAYSQSNNRSVSRTKPGEFAFGANLSPTISWLDVEHKNLSTDGATITGGFGFVAEYNTRRIFSLVSGLNFILPGGYVFDSLSLADNTTKNNFRVNYSALEIPLLLRVNTLPVNNTSYYTQGGFTAAFRLKSTEFHRAASFENANIKTDITDLSKPIFLNFTAGFGAKFYVSRFYTLFAEVNYKNSLINMASDVGYLNAGRYPGSATPLIYSGNMVFSVGVLF